MSYNKNWFPRLVFWKNLKKGKCPILNCEGKIVKIDKMYECDSCTNFKISIKKYLRLSK